jgi:hypothetical protein
MVESLRNHVVGCCHRFDPHTIALRRSYLNRPKEIAKVLSHTVRIGGNSKAAMAAVRIGIQAKPGKEDAKAAHFSGQVAAALNASSDELVLGGWDKGVVSHIKSHRVLSGTFR